MPVRPFYLLIYAALLWSQIFFPALTLYQIIHQKELTGQAGWVQVMTGSCAIAAVFWAALIIGSPGYLYLLTFIPAVASTVFSFTRTRRPLLRGSAVLFMTSAVALLVFAALYPPITYNPLGMPRR